MVILVLYTIVRHQEIRTNLSKDLAGISHQTVVEVIILRTVWMQSSKIWKVINLCSTITKHLKVHHSRGSTQEEGTSNNESQLALKMSL